MRMPVFELLLYCAVSVSGGSRFTGNDFKKYPYYILLLLLHYH